MVTSFTSTPSEEHFYFVSLLIELQGAAALRLMATSLDELFVNDLLAHQRITQNLLGLSDVLDDLSQIFETMRNDCEPDVFYNDIRPWFNGGEFILDLGKSEPSQTQNYGGPSAGQSTVIHALDVFLGVDHRPRSDANQSFDDTFMQRMSAYMPQSDSRVFTVWLK